MKQAADNIIMASAFGTINRILRHIERRLDCATFDEDAFTAEAFDITHNRFARYLSMLLDAGYVSGMRILDNGEPTEFDGDARAYRRYDIITDSPSITIRGIQFLAENTVVARVYGAVKSIRDLAP